MAKISGGLFSLSASGTLADTLTFSRWKGIPYARTRVIPANPQTTDQTQTRDVFSFLQALYKRLPAIGTEPWIASAVGNPLTPINAIIKANIPPLRTAVDLDLMILSPGSGGGLPPAAVVVTPGSGQLSIAVTAPTPPTGWTVVSAQAVALRDQDPHDDLIAAPVAGEDTTSPYTIVLTGLTGSQVYQVGVWIKWMTASGKTAYSTATRSQNTPS
jgi:hypothetical protein